MKIQVAGPGCGRCKATEKLVQEACSELGIQADIEHVYDVKAYVKLGVRLTPAVVVDGKVVFSGKVPTAEELKELLSEAA